MSTTSVFLMLMPLSLTLFSQPMMMILLIATSICMSSIFLAMVKMGWASLVIILSTVGGLLVMYMLVFTLSPNESNKYSQINKMIMIIPFTFMSTPLNLQNKTNQMVSMFSLNWMMIIIITSMISLVTITTSMMTLNPQKSMKTMIF